MQSLKGFQESASDGTASDVTSGLGLAEDTGAAASASPRSSLPSGHEGSGGWQRAVARPVP